MTAPKGEKSDESSVSVASWGSCFFFVMEKREGTAAVEKKMRGRGRRRKKKSRLKKKKQLSLQLAIEPALR